MRLGIEVTTCTPSRTGVGYYTEHLVDALLATRREGDDVVLFSNRPPAPVLAERWRQHLQVRGPEVRAVWMQTEATRVLTDAGVDVAVFPNYVVPLASPCPAIVVVHDLAILRTPRFFTLRKRLLMQLMLKPSVAAASLVATVSEASRRDIVDLLGTPRERIALLPCAAHPSCRPAAPEAVAAVRARYRLPRRYVLTVGTLEPRKNLRTLLRAFDRLGAEAPEHDLVVVGGRGWQDRQLVGALRSRRANPRVRWLGYVGEADLAPLYSGADLFVFASALEGFGLPALEAMACGAPVIASDVAALREVCGDAARFVPPSDDAAWARAIGRSLRAPDELGAARSAGLLQAQRFSWTRTAEMLWARARTVGPARIRSGVPAHAPGIADSSAPSCLQPIPPKLSAREWALLSGVVYADLFDSPLAVDEMARASFGFTFDEADVRRAVQSPALAPWVTLDSTGFLVLVGRERLVDAIPERQALTLELLDRNRAILSVLAALPFVRAILLSGGLAHRNPGKRPDVDLFVIAAGGRAYTAYTLLFLATKILGKRHVVCPNYLVDEREMAIAYHPDLFTAHQVVSARPFSGPETYEAFCRANEGWVRRFFPAFVPRLEPSSLPATARWQRLGELALAPTAPLVESLTRLAWRIRLRARAARAAGCDVVLSDGILKLHLSDYRRSVLERFAGRLASLRAQIGGDAPLPRASPDPVAP